MRRFKLQGPAKPNFDAVDVFDMIDRALYPISKPPVIKAITDTELGNIMR